ncbi:MAG: replication initiation protein [Methylicorpusculum sp.]|uniref:replication initiation protein n=1 Tax=Methylicorpusculum sp. TaxID=2713644 RepID=UPI00272649E0|nr:replication initiation protein [Methylicorpusculum sp.]MDO8845253.1 replication initiation protein [Methylicorpusculum sp.]MDO8938078.1 replication initiation protein [Methylicorpusculum sp.]MDP2178921.1 replication initiation protein [Methylicorpusculum sp.]MDP3530306.1 replication initiation protein [Methylicorpusculum sp.]MDZ4152230.1 replication initiation protein [Methylicorpusculum sp.]
MTSLKNEEINVIVKKHKAIINCENSLPLASRKIFNILLFLVKDRFGKDIEHQVSESDVIALLNKTDKDITSARINYKKLAATVIEYNILNNDKDHLNGVGTMLAPAEINTTKKTWNFSFPPNIVKWVQDPKSFVFLDITTQERFCSKYSQALWEICIGSLEDQLESYFSVTLDECRMLMCGKDNHQTYKDFKRRVISVALNEINEKSLLHVKLYKEVKEGRRVSELVFVVTKQDYAEPSLFASNDDLYIKMVDVFGITANVARLMAEKYDDDRISRNLEYTEQQYRKAIKNNKESQFNLGAYATSAITKDYAPKHPQLLINIIEEKAKKKEMESNVIVLKKKAGEEAMNRVISIFEALDRNLQMTLKNEFEKNGLRGPVKKIFDQEGWSSERINSHFYIFLTAQVEQGRKGEGYDQIIKLLKMNDELD